MHQLDTRGYSCPEPVLMTKRALEQGRPLTVLVDGETPLQNITRFAQNAGYRVEIRPVDGDYEMVIS